MLLYYDLAESAEDVAETTGLRVAFRTVIHNVDRIGDAVVGHFDLVEAGKVVG